MPNKTQRIVAYITSSFEKQLEDAVDKYSLSKSEILRRGLVREVKALREGGAREQ